VIRDFYWLHFKGVKVKRSLIKAIYKKQNLKNMETIYGKGKRKDTYRLIWTHGI
jgi:hypothetical protein